MTEQSMYARHKFKLNSIYDILEDLNFKLNYENKNAEIPFDVLHVAIADGSSNEEVVCMFSINFIPVSDEFVGNVDLLQMMSFLNCTFSIETKGILLKLLDNINSKTILGSFYTSNDKIVFKYTHAIPILSQINQDDFREIIMLFVYMHNVFSKLVESYVKNEKTLAEVLKELEL